MPAITNERLDAGGVELSAIRGEPDGAARATVVALPGGGYNATYWHHPDNLDASIIELGSALGFRTYAIDRPGYGISAQNIPGGYKLDHQVTLLTALVEQIAKAPGAGAGVFLIGHSMGGILSLRIAAKHPAGLLGVDVSGVPLRFSATLADAVAATLESNGTESTGDSAAELFYGPVGAYDPVLPKDDPSLAPPPVTELADSSAWPDQFIETASRIEVPVRYTLGDHEIVTETGESALRETASYFERSSRVETSLQARAGHNVSLHYIARAFHLRALAFFEETLALDRD